MVTETAMLDRLPELGRDQRSCASIATPPQIEARPQEDPPRAQ